MAELLTAILGDTKAVTAVIAAGIALLGVIISGFVSAIISRRSTYISSVTAERSKWIDKLRTNLSELVGKLGYLHYKLHTGSEGTLNVDWSKSTEHDEIVRQSETLIALVRLQLNPLGTIDSNIISLLLVMPAEARKRDAYRDLEDLFIRHVQWLLKAEWEKVKLESAGLLTRYLWAWPRQVLRDCAYDEFCERDGSIFRYVRAA